MTTPSPESVATFMGITGATEFVAVQKLEEYGGNLNEAVNAHFIGDRHIQEQNLAATATPHYDYSEANNQNNQNRAGLSYAGADTNGSLSSHGRGYYGSNDYPNDYPLAQSSASRVHDEDAEDAMLLAAIEASKKEIRESSSQSAHNHSYYDVTPQSYFAREDDDLAHIISLSLQTAENEEAIRELRAKEENEVLGAHALLAEGERINTNRSKLEWGGISPDKLNEALLIETALYGETSNQSSHKFPSLPDLQHHSEKNADPRRQCSSSSGSQLLSETQLIRQQQDADYIASLQADKQKELNSLNKSETYSSKQEEKHKNTLERTELEKTGDAKKNMLPNEPPLGDEKAITIAVRMPDGGRCERRFFKTDKLQLLFDFIDIYGAVKPGTYRVVSYPRRAYNVNDRSATLNEVGLSNKNEALFLELQNDYPLAQSSASRVHDEDAEDAMLLAAIEASKKEIRESSSQNAHNHSYYDVPQQSHFEREDDDLAHVISLSLQNDYPLAQSSASRVHDEDAEDAMLLAAIEASKKEIRESSSQNANNHSYYDVPQQSHFEREDDLAHAISLSLQELLPFYGLPLSHTPVEVAVQPPPTSLPHGVQYEIHTLPVDAKAVADGDGLTVYVSTADPRESSRVPCNVHIAAVHRAEARSRRNYEEAEALRKQIVDAGYRMILFENGEILAKKYRIRLRGIDAPENAMPYGKEAKTELTKIVQGKSLRVLIYGEDQYQRLVGDIYCNNIFVQELMLKKGLAWHYAAYDKRPELETWEKEARAKRVGLWASKNPEKPWDWRKDRRN